jgi:hypothetical protein
MLYLTFIQDVVAVGRQPLEDCERDAEAGPGSPSSDQNEIGI